MYLAKNTRQHYAPFLNKQESLTYLPESLYPLRSRTSGFGSPNRGMAVASVNKGVFEA